MVVQRTIIPWTIVASEDHGDAIAAQLLEGRRPCEGSTAIGQAIAAKLRNEVT